MAKPGDIIEVYLLLRNLDEWTVGKFQALVEAGVNRLAKGVKNKGRRIEPWRRRSAYQARDEVVAAGESISSPVKRSVQTRSSRKKT